MGPGGGRARGGRDGYTREGARTSRQKIFFPFLVASLGISFSLKQPPPPPPPLAPLCPCFAASAGFSCRAPCIFAKIGRVERRNGADEERARRRKKRVAAGCGDLFLASYRALVRWPGRLIEPRPTPRRCHKRVACFFSFFFFTALLWRKVATLLQQIVIERETLLLDF